MRQFLIMNRIKENGILNGILKKARYPARPDIRFIPNTKLYYPKSILTNNDIIYMYAKRIYKYIFPFLFAFILLLNSKIYIEYYITFVLITI